MGAMREELLAIVAGEPLQAPADTADAGDVDDTLGADA
jgi:hypothetical protein